MYGRSKSLLKIFSTNINTLQKITCCTVSQTHLDICKKFLQYQNKATSSSIIEKKAREFCNVYKNTADQEKYQLFKALATQCAFEFENVNKLCNNYNFNQLNDTKMLQLSTKLRPLLTPKYNWMFVHIGRLENGVKFLVDMRNDLLLIINKMKFENDEGVPRMQLMNSTLKDLLYLWFSVGFLKLERLTWKSSCDMLQKISDYEAVHPIHNWTDLKLRLGSYRRCYVYTHNSMPGEPIVVLHTLLTDDIISSVHGLTVPALKTAQNLNQEIQEDAENIKAAIFYSITSPHMGLQGIELGNSIIKQVARKLLREYPGIEKFSTLSPIPKFRHWLFAKLKAAEQKLIQEEEIFKEDELNELRNILNEDAKNVLTNLRKMLSSNIWLQSEELVCLLEKPMKRICARYLYLEKNRGYALDNVANFHLRNGAEMWRINWLADTSARGLTNSCGIMVNYRYFLDSTEMNSQLYIEQKIIKTSTHIEDILQI